MSSDETADKSPPPEGNTLIICFVCAGTSEKSVGQRTNYLNIYIYIYNLHCKFESVRSSGFLGSLSAECFRTGESVDSDSRARRPISEPEREIFTSELDGTFFKSAPLR